jgi:hypothetical protein
MTITALSLGWGVQSFTIAAMAALGDMDCPDLVLHVDTTWEREATYAYAAAMTPWLRDRGVHVTVVRDKKAHIPLLRSSRSDLTYTQIPTFTEGNGRRAQMRRQCTAHWKIYTQDMVIRRWLREHGYPKGTVVHRLLGISLDEWQRARSSADSQFVLTYPLLERRMTRQDCAAYLQRHGLPIPPKSSCVMCPYHHNAAWVEMKREGGAIGNVRATMTMPFASKPGEMARSTPRITSTAHASRLPRRSYYLKTCPMGNKIF